MSDRHPFLSTLLCQRSTPSEQTLRLIPQASHPFAAQMHPNEFDYQSNSWRRTPQTGLDLLHMLRNLYENTRQDSTRMKIENIFRLDKEEGTTICLIQLRNCAKDFTKSTLSKLKRILKNDTRLLEMTHLQSNRFPGQGWFAYQIVLPPVTDSDEIISWDMKDSWLDKEV